MLLLCTPISCYSYMLFFLTCMWVNIVNFLLYVSLIGLLAGILLAQKFSTSWRIRHFCSNRGDPWRFCAEMWKVANSARLQMRPRGTGDQPGDNRRGKMKDRQSYRTKLPTFSHQLEHVGPNKQISDIYLLIRAQRDSIRSQTLHSKGTSYDITKYQTFLTKYGIVCPFKRNMLTAEG